MAKKKAKKTSAKKSKELTDIQLGMMLSKNHQNLMVAQQNIQEINAELNRRQMLNGE